MDDDTECSVVNCANRPTKTKVFYKFPVAFDTCMQWLQHTGNRKLLQDFSLGGTELFMEKFICSDHFLDNDFAVLGQPHSGLRCNAIPHNKRKERPKVDIPRQSSTPLTKDKISNSGTVEVPLIKPSHSKSDVPLCLVVEAEKVYNKRLSDAELVPKNEPEKWDVSELSIGEEGTAFNRSSNDVLPIETIIKEEPEDQNSDDTLTETLRFPLMEREHENIDATYDVVSVVSTEGPQLIESTLPLPVTTFNFIETGSESMKLKQPKTEALDIEEVLLPDTFSENDEDSMDVDVEDQLKEVPDYYVGDLPRYKSAVRAAIKRSTESEEEKRIRQEKNRVRAAERRANMTPTEREEWRRRNRIQTRERREKETEIKKLVRRYNNALRASIKRSEETPAQRMERRYKDAIRAAQRRRNETPEEREERLRKDRERITLRRLQMLMSESPEQREERLRKERERMYRKRHGIKDDEPIKLPTKKRNKPKTFDEKYHSLSAILSMYPPNIEIPPPEDNNDTTCPLTIEPHIEIHPQDSIETSKES